MDLGIAGKTAVVIGGTSNLGRECAERLAEEKVNILLFSRGVAALNKAAAEISSKHGVRVWVEAGDMTQKEDVLRLRQRAVSLGGIDILVHNTARPPMPMRDVLEEQDDSRWDEAYQTQLWASILVIRELAPLLVERGWGRIITITSASVKQPMPHHALSTVFRSGMTALLKHLANEVASKGVTVNCVCPASILTDGLRKDWDLKARAERSPMKRLGKMSELAGAVVFFASEQAGYITGTSLPVDGGMTASLI